MVLRLGTEVLEDALLPESLHEVPVLNHSVTDGVFGGVTHGVRLIAYVEICTCVCVGGIVSGCNMLINARHYTHPHCSRTILNKARERE